MERQAPVAVSSGLDHPVFAFSWPSDEPPGDDGTYLPFYLSAACLHCRIAAILPIPLSRHRLLVEYQQEAAISRAGAEHDQEEEKETGAATGEAEVAGQV